MYEIIPLFEYDDWLVMEELSTIHFFNDELGMKMDQMSVDTNLFTLPHERVIRKLPTRPVCKPSVITVMRLQHQSVFVIT